MTAIDDIDPTPIVNEAVGTGDGASGGTKGDFALDYPIAAVADLSGGTFTVGGVDKTAALVAGSAVQVPVKP